MAYCLALPGAYGNVFQMQQQLRGQITAGKTLVPIGYSNWGNDDWRIEQGVEMLDQALHDFAGGDITVFGNDLGARVTNKWLYELGDSSGINPLKTKFINIGDPTNRYGGVYKDLGSMPPTDTVFKLTTIIRQYDGYADYPHDLTNDNATSEAWYGTSYVHPDYYSVDPDPDAEGNFKFVQGNITYVWNRTYPLPSVDPISPTLRMLGFISNSTPTPQPLVQDQDQAKRPLVEAGYARPVVIPPPDYT